MSRHVCGKHLVQGCLSLSLQYRKDYRKLYLSYRNKVAEDRFETTMKSFQNNYDAPAGWNLSAGWRPPCILKSTLALESFSLLPASKPDKNTQLLYQCVHFLNLLAFTDAPIETSEPFSAEQSGVNTFHLHPILCTITPSSSSVLHMHIK